jgi:tetratricopeptide (TPR) repeat protein
VRFDVQIVPNGNSTEPNKMNKISRVGILSFSVVVLASLTGCSIINKVRARNELNDGAKAYKERRFAEAEEHFTQAMALDPSQPITEVLMARTLHQQYLANRTSPDNIKRAETAIDIYKKILANNPNDEVTNDAISSLIGALKGPQALNEWRQQRANDTRVSPASRAKAMTFLAADKYTCVNQITEANKETVNKGKELVYNFKKPANPEDLATAKQCAEEGLNLIEQALKLDDKKSSPWSYKASLLTQKSRIAEMEGNNADKERYKAEAEAPKKRFQELSEAEAKAKEEEAKRKAEEEAAK